MQNRIRSKTAWAAVIALGLFIAKTYYKVEIPEADALVNMLLGTATALGIFNNPTDKEKF